MHSLRLRPGVVTAGFVILFAVIANLAWATAITTTGPWYDAVVSSPVYVLGAAIAALLAVVLVANATRSAAALRASLRRVDRRVVLLRTKAAPASGPTSALSPEKSLDEFDIDSALDAPTGHPTVALVRVEKEGHDSLIPLPVAAASASRSEGKSMMLSALVRERIALREAHARVWAVAAGPVVACLVFLAIAGPMLPGSGAFATAHYQLNTTMVLFLSYGLAPLVAWALLALAWVGNPRDVREAGASS